MESVSSGSIIDLVFTNKLECCFLYLIHRDRGLVWHQLLDVIVSPRLRGRASMETSLLHHSLSLSLVLSLIKQCPFSFWPVLLLDTLPLLKTKEPVISSEQTYELMYILDTLSNSTRLVHPWHQLQVGEMQGLAYNSLLSSFGLQIFKTTLTSLAVYASFHLS